MSMKTYPCRNGYLQVQIKIWLQGYIRFYLEINSIQSKIQKHKNIMSNHQ